MGKRREAIVFDDRRSKKVILVAHCLLNQNARIDHCAYFPGAMAETARAIVDSGVGVLQMPCPELQCLGLDRSGRIRDGKDIGIREALLGEAKESCQALVQGVMRDVTEYRKHGFQVLGVIGNDGSPACGVNRTWYVGDSPGPGAGAFMLMLREALQKQGVDIPFVVTEDHKWAERLPRIQALLRAS
jgi:predicted secreted protein